MSLPYVMSIRGGRMLAIKLEPEWLKADRSGRPLLLPAAVRALDRLRAVFTDQEGLTPGLISSLRGAMGMTQGEFGRKLGVSKITVSRWECGRTRPGAARGRAIRELQVEARREGVKIDSEKHTDSLVSVVKR